MKNKFKIRTALLIATLALSFAKAEAKTGGARTNANPVVDVNVPFAFQVGNRMLPAGHYQLELATGAPTSHDTMSVLVLRNREAMIYQAIAVPVNVNAGSAIESRAVFSDGDQHILLAVWENGNRLDLEPAMLAAADNADDWTDGGRLVNVAFHPAQ